MMRSLGLYLSKANLSISVQLPLMNLTLSRATFLIVLLNLSTRLVCVCVCEGHDVIDAFGLHEAFNSGLLKLRHGHYFVAWEPHLFEAPMQSSHWESSLSVCVFHRNDVRQFAEDVYHNHTVAELVVFRSCEIFTHLLTVLCEQNHVHDVYLILKPVEGIGVRIDASLSACSMGFWGKLTCHMSWMVVVGSSSPAPCARPRRTEILRGVTVKVDVADDVFSWQSCRHFFSL